MTLRTIGDAPRTITTTPKAIVEWERHMKTKISRAEIGMEDLCFMAYESLRATGSVVVPFDVWLASVEEIDFQDGADSTVPTAPAP